MKQKSLPKSFFLIAVVFSLAAFVFVNVHASLTIPQHLCTQTKMEQTQLKECQDTDTQEMKIPDVTVLGRLLKLAQKFLTIAN